MGDLEAKLAEVPVGVIESYLNTAANFLQAQQFKMSDATLGKVKQTMEDSQERLMWEIKSRQIGVSSADLSKYLLGVAVGNYRKRKDEFEAEQRRMPFQEAATLEAGGSSLYAMVQAGKYQLLVEEVLSGRFELVPNASR